MEIKREDWVLLALYYAGDRSLSPVQLQKSLFILGENLPKLIKNKLEYYHFTPYNYGPFDVNIYKDALDLSKKGLLNIQYSLGKSYPDYVVTENGVKVAKEIDKAVNKEITKYLEKIISWIKDLSFYELLKIIYKFYPQFKINSVFRE